MNPTSQQITNDWTGHHYQSIRGRVWKEDITEFEVCRPSVLLIERSVINISRTKTWVLDPFTGVIFGYPDDLGGILLTSGTTVNDNMLEWKLFPDTTVKHKRPQL